MAEQSKWTASRMHTDVFALCEDGKTNIEIVLKGWDFASEVVALLNKDKDISPDSAITQTQANYKQKMLDSWGMSSTTEAPNG